MILSILSTQGAKIFRLGEMCRKLETEQEKVLPFYASSLTKEEDEQATTDQVEAPTETLAKVWKIEIISQCAM